MIHALSGLAGLGLLVGVYFFVDATMTSLGTETIMQQLYVRLQELKAVVAFTGGLLLLGLCEIHHALRANGKKEAA